MTPRRRHRPRRRFFFDRWILQSDGLGCSREILPNQLLLLLYSFYLSSLSCLLPRLLPDQESFASASTRSSFTSFRSLPVRENSPSSLPALGSVSLPLSSCGRRRRQRAAPAILLSSLSPPLSLSPDMLACRPAPPMPDAWSGGALSTWRSASWVAVSTHGVARLGLDGGCRRTFPC